MLADKDGMKPVDGPQSVEGSKRGFAGTALPPVVDVDNALCAEIDAERAVCEETGLPAPNLGQLREEGPDPCGVNWAWANGAEFPTLPLPASSGTALDAQEVTETDQSRSKLSPEMVTRIRAEIERRVAANEPVNTSRFKDDGPDPLGIGFAWAGEEVQPSTDQTNPDARDDAETSLHRAIDVDAALCAEIDADRAACEEGSLPPPDLGTLRDEGRDPFGTDWSWTRPPKTDQ